MAEFSLNENLVNDGKQRRKGSQNETERYTTELVLKLLKKRLFSSPAAFLSILEQHESSLKQAQKRPSRQLMKPTVEILQRQLDANEEYEEFTESAIAATSP
ncbi:hypothetical protein [Dactylococcopsis salina]|uniref:hypothetical protein n=1 Tax=Dactylococcopsis salina TaxID=292566 RepID=UPI0002E3537D|nr:hypothetical protein [Dactylococcopsis salina]